MAKSKSNNHLFKIEFYGPNLETRSIPISGLGKILVAFQQIIHKCYLYEEERLRPGAQLSRPERDALALQLGKHSKGPDNYSFIAFLTKSTVVKNPELYVEQAIDILSTYANKKINKLLKTKQPNLISQVYNQVKEITIQINNNIRYLS